MEALHGKLWETNKESDLDKYHELRKIKPLENGLEKYDIFCWASGVRSVSYTHLTLPTTPYV